MALNHKFQFLLTKVKIVDLSVVIFRRKGKRITVNFVSPKRAQLKVLYTFQNSAVSITYLLISRSRILSSLQQQSLLGYQI